MPLPPRASTELIPLVILGGSSAEEGNEARAEWEGLHFIPKFLASLPSTVEQNTGADTDLRHLSSPAEISALHIHQERAQKHFGPVLAFSRT